MGLFVARLDPRGNVLWGETFGDSGNQYCNALAVGAGGDILVSTARLAAPPPPWPGRR